jgi:dethiobiotin synthase
LRYWKPIQTGIERDDDTAEVLRLTGHDRRRVLERGVRLERPVSPHLAARLGGLTIRLDALIDLIASEPATDRWIVEGAGGVLVPINPADSMADLIVRLGLPALVVARTALGTINHTLLTLEALRARSAAVAGVVMVGPGDAENRRAIEEYGRVQVVGELPTLDPLTPATLSEWSRTGLDRDGRLAAALE